MDCSENQYYDTGECYPCVQCPPGQELTEDCGYGYGALARCRPCDTRWFKEAWGSHTCQMCQACRRVNRRELSPCMPTRNAVCGPCLPGFYSKRRLDGQESLECMPCGPPPFRDPLCRRSSGVEMEKFWRPQTTSQSTTAAVTTYVCLAVAAMVILLSVTLFMYHKYTSLRTFFKGCLIPHCSSNDAEAPSVFMETQCPLTSAEEEQVSGVTPTQTTSDKGSPSSEEGCSFSAMPTALCDWRGHLSCPPHPSICSDCLSGLTSQPTSGLPTPLPVSGHLTAVPMSATGGGHCSSEEGSGWLQQWHVPVECTELDIHESFPPGEAELHTFTGSGSEPGLPREVEHSLDLYSAVPLDSNLELHGCLETGRTNYTEEPTSSL
ncbi:tumor necrosis factor receptor superfamily member 27 [Alosa sapidissima]|uniref:tumor necrosis factor receptor superfamily member 27 n=1 Tax=Alosa sapidissima TaxID=34773 RepID=UPI001C090915|nr:tumor necrosis factor receptor superfamily member 27 [Alosa sapidissima]XP_041949536.1 tumor necrosis factor receptor superfamily member 27 [Alosa sapidissima]XP_041949537.1 tumor necrosis factor receptor superfamily member 27 [Alosa sapidissima]XP_041949538.1 tumor necrosis factor receptor superfamily member 27 [Alosa sapidissima]